jgi:hypothetical protein
MIVLTSINRGVPIMVDQRAKPIGQAIQQFSERVVAEFRRPAELAGPAEDARKRSGLRR